MYCSSCGVAVAQDLSYCNFCGVKLSGGKSDDAGESPQVNPELLIPSMVAVFVLGLAAIIVMMGVMKAVLGLSLGLILGFTLLTFLMMVLLECVFLRLLFRRKRGAAETGDTVELKGPATKELDAAQSRVLTEPRPSVTENTTRTFDPIYNERTRK